jgi:5-methylcytosine-specific restriction endonuclease McrA
MKPQNSRCLLLNIDFTPLSVMDWTKAVVWSIKYAHDKRYGIEIVDFYKNDHINGVNNKKYPIPAVAKTKRFLRINKQTVTFSRKNIYIRDEYTCQYCNQQFHSSNLTYDHVVPKSQWRNKLSPTCWTNIVTACVECNHKKGSKTPKQANMPLKQLPIMPTKNVKYLPIAHYLYTIRYDIPAEWKMYLPDSYIL